MTEPPPSIRLTRPHRIDRDDVATLYAAVGWSTYAEEPRVLQEAIDGSSYVVTALDEERLVGLARCISDDVSIAYIQDIVVHPGYHRQGIGRALALDCLDRYAHVRQKVLLTDDRPGQLAFYSDLGFHNTRELARTPLNAFVIIEGVDLG